MTAEGVLRAMVRAELRNAGLSQAEAARRLGVSTKHLCQMLTGKAPLTLAWAEDLLRLCGKRLGLTVTPGRSPPSRPRAPLCAPPGRVCDEP